MELCDLRQTFVLDVTDVPPEAAFLKVDLVVDSIICNPPANNPPLDAQFSAGIDDMYLSFTADPMLPEPGTFVILMTALPTVWAWDASRRKESPVTNS